MDPSTMKCLVVLALLLCACSVAAQNATHCLDDVDACLPQFRARLIDTDYYWFGGAQFAQCTDFANCINARPDLQSVLARVLATNDSATLQTAVSNIQILNVTFELPATKYFSCDTTFTVPSSDPKTLDPLTPAMLPQKTIHLAQPQITWTARSSETLYSFILLDSSYLILHSFLTNCPGGSLDGCEVVKPWLGSSLSYVINSPYTHMVFEQTARVPIQTALQAVTLTTIEGFAGSSSPVGAFYISSLVQKLAAYVTSDIKFASIMEMYPDPFGAFRATYMFAASDQCPLYYSQLPAFYAAVRSLEIPTPQWSSPAFSYSQMAIAPYLATITVHPHVTYETDDFTDTACCTQFEITRGTHRVSALDTRPVRAAMTREAPQIFLSPVNLMSRSAGRDAIAAIPYTLLAVDVTPALTSNATGSNLTIHWLVVNIYDSDFASGTELVPYSAPVPVDANEPVALMFLLFAQSTPVDTRTLNQLCPEDPTMCKVRVLDLISTLGLGDIAGVNWVQVEEDGFSIKRQYTEMDRSVEDVCSGRDGYAKPCPDQQPCSAIGQCGFGHPYLVALLAALVLVERRWFSQ